MSEALVISILQIALALVFVGVIVLIWTAVHIWFADNRKLTNTDRRSTQSWNEEHEFFHTIEEFRNDFSGR